MKVWSVCAEDATSYRSFVCRAAVTSLMPPSLRWDSTVPDSSEKNPQSACFSIQKNLPLKQCDYYHFQKWTGIIKYLCFAINFSYLKVPESTDSLYFINVVLLHGKENDAHTIQSLEIQDWTENHTCILGEHMHMHITIKGAICKNWLPVKSILNWTNISPE